MILKAYSIYDRKALQYHAPFFATAHGSAIRSFMDLANDGQTAIGTHPGDYCLYFIGLYDDEHGMLQPLAAIEHLTDALPLLRVQPALFQAPDTNDRAGLTPNGKDAG